MSLITEIHRGDEPITVEFEVDLRNWELTYSDIPLTSDEVDELLDLAYVTEGYAEREYQPLR